MKYLLIALTVCTIHTVNAVADTGGQSCSGWNTNSKIKSVNVGAYQVSDKNLGFLMENANGKQNWAWSAFNMSTDVGKAYLTMGLHAASLGLKVSYDCNSSGKLHSLYINY